MLHGKILTVIPYKCEMSSLAGALGKLKHGQDPGRNLLVCLININSHQFIESVLNVEICH